MFKQLTDTEENHHCHRFRIFADTDGADRGNNHQEVFIKDVAVDDALQCFGNHLIARYQVGQQIHWQKPKAHFLQDSCSNQPFLRDKGGNEKRCGNEDFENISAQFALVLLHLAAIAAGTTVRMFVFVCMMMFVFVLTSAVSLMMMFVLHSVSLLKK